MSGYVEFIKPSYSAVKSVNGKIGAVELTAEDLNAATEEYVAQKIAEAELSGGDVDLSAYYTKSQTDAKIKQAVEAIPQPEVPTKVSQLQNDAGYLTEHQSLEGYATEAFVEQKISEAELGGGDVDVDLSNYYTKSEIDGKLENLDVEADVDLSAYYTKDEVDAKIPSLDGYAKTTDIPDTSKFALKSEIPDVSAYQTEAQVQALINASLPASAEEVKY